MAYGSVNVPGDLSGKQNLITGVPGQVVGIGADGKATPLTLTPGPNVTLKQEGTALKIGAVVPGKNLFHNWYLKDPIIQYDTPNEVIIGPRACYKIDRWETVVSDNKGRVQFRPNDGLYLYNEPDTDTAAYSSIIQRSDDMSDLIGRSVTLSILTYDGLYMTNMILGGHGTKVMCGPFAIYSVVQNGNGVVENLVRMYHTSSGFQAPGIIAVKLELGNQQTLAYQDAEGRWVLNDPPPNKALELLKCQRY